VNEIGKYDVVLGPATANGKVLGVWVRPRTARQAAEERWNAALLRKQWAEHVASAKNSFRTPIFGDQK